MISDMLHCILRHVALSFNVCQVCVRVCMHVHSQVYARVHMSVCMCARLCMRVSMCTYAHAYLSVFPKEQAEELCVKPS